MNRSWNGLGEEGSRVPGEAPSLRQLSSFSGISYSDQGEEEEQNCSQFGSSSSRLYCAALKIGRSSPFPFHSLSAFLALGTNLHINCFRLQKHEYRKKREKQVGIAFLHPRCLPEFDGSTHKDALFQQFKIYLLKC